MKKCQRCPEQPVIHITELDEDGFQEIHLCYKHAQEYLREEESSSPVISESQSATALIAAGTEAITSSAQCPLCNLNFEDFRSSGRLGCPQDYDVFKTELGPLLESIHGGLQHVGKVPKHLPANTRARTRLFRLRQELQQAVAVEDYEKAAKLRDGIDKLEKEKQ